MNKYGAKIFYCVGVKVMIYASNKIDFELTQILKNIYMHANYLIFLGVYIRGTCWRS